MPPGGWWTEGSKRQGLEVLHGSSEKEFDAGAVPRKDFLRNLKKDALKYQALGITEQVMLSFTTDPYHPGNTKPTRRTLKILRNHSLAFCTLTKGGTRALRDIKLFRPERDAFASTLTTLDDRFSRKSERNAPLPGDRIQALRAFHELGIFTRHCRGRCRRHRLGRNARFASVVGIA
jgi:DNA repair photolyase